MSQNYQSLQGVFTEKEVSDLLGLSKDQLAALRYDGLPFVKLNDRRRLYIEDDLMEWFK